MRGEMPEDLYRKLREAGEPVDPRRPAPVYFCPVCGTVWLPATTYQRTAEDMTEAFQRSLRRNGTEERPHATCQGA